MQKHKYSKHIFLCLDQIVSDLTLAKSTYESKLMYKALKPSIDILRKKNVNKLINFSKVLTTYKFDYKKINELISFLNISLGKPTLSKRQNRKFNSSYQNLMLTAFLVESPDETYQFIKKFATDNNFPADFLIRQIKQRVQNGLEQNALVHEAVIPIHFSVNENHFQDFDNEEIYDDFSEGNDIEHSNSFWDFS